MADIIALVGSESLLGREIRELAESTGLDALLKPIAEEEREAGKVVRMDEAPSILFRLDRETLADAGAVILAGSAESSKKALEFRDDATFIDLTQAADSDPRARLRAPVVEPEGFFAGETSVHVIAHPAAIALAILLNRIHERYPIARAVVTAFEPASQRGLQGVDEMQKQTVSLLSFQPMPKAIYDTQVSFNLRPVLGEDSPFPLAPSEARIEKHLAILLANSSGAPPPSLRLIHAPVFHGYTFSVWIEFEGENPGPAELERVLSAEGIDVRSSDVEPPDNLAVAGQSGIAVGAIAADRQNKAAVWVWMAADNVRLLAENGLAVAREV